MITYHNHYIPAVCATEGCERPARWIPISEGNRGSRLYRCVECCDNIAAVPFPCEFSERSSAVFAAKIGDNYCRCESCQNLRASL